MAVKFNIPLVFYGEPPGEYGAKVDIHKNKFEMIKSSQGDNQNYGCRLDFVNSKQNPDEVYLGGKSMSEYLKEGINRGELSSYLPLDPNMIIEKNIEFHFLGYYLKWIPQECYYYAVEHTGFEPNSVRTEGTYSKYNSIDDKIDPFFYYTQYIKFGFGRATHDASQEIRNHHLTREEGVALVKKFDGELPQRYLGEFLDYISMTEAEFYEVCDKFRTSSLWKKENDIWKLYHAVYDESEFYGKDGIKDKSYSY